MEEKELKGQRTGGATSWPRMKDRPAPLPISEVLFYLFILYTRPVFQVVFVMQMFFPLWYRIASYCLNELHWSEHFFFAVVTVGTHHLFYAIVNGFFTFIEYFELLDQYRLYTPPAAKPSYDLKKEAFLGSVFATLPMFVGSYFGHQAFVYFGTPSALTPLPSSFELWKYYCILKTCATLLFDFIHRTIHSKYMYSKIHAKHHRFIATISIAAEFAHPVEGVGTVLAAMCMGGHVFSWCVWLGWSQIDAGMTHSGYCFHIFTKRYHKVLGLGFNADESVYHHHHHYQNKGNFSHALVDAIFGTHDSWLAMGRTSGYIEISNKKKLELKGARKLKK